MGVGEVFGRLQKFLSKPSGEKISSNEVELRSYLERERQDNIKKLVHQYRLRDSREIILGKSMDGDATLLRGRNVFRNKTTLNNGRPILSHRRRI